MAGKLTSSLAAIVPVANHGYAQVWACYEGEELQYWDVYVEGVCINEGDPFYDKQPDSTDIFLYMQSKQ